jgi:hypothetical protein
MADAPPYDTSQWLSTGELLRRGWARRWAEPLLGQPMRCGHYRLWPRAAVLETEKLPILREARAQLDTMATRSRYITPEQEEHALELALERVISRLAALLTSMEDGPYTLH